MGHITKLLMANRGEIARRVMRTCRAMGIATVAVHSDPDADAPFVLEADEAVALGGSSSADSYLRVDALVAAALRTGADAVHPGYGFLSENAEFAQACIDAGLVFVGPSPRVIELMGSKVTAKELMAAAGVPILPSEDVTMIEGAGLEAAAERVGLPVLVKASFGGGGKGMRSVRSMPELSAAVESARREAVAAFGNGAVFLERCLDAPRHVEIQIFGDRQGRVVHLFERECSIQRRHQKIVEEAPSPAVDADLRERMGAAAVEAARAVGYVGAGTVEFLLAPDGAFFFLEMNTRLQVEHPVTEAVTGLDLVRLQLLVAQGYPLPDDVASAGLSGHAIEARLYAEDPERNFIPVAGTLRRFEIDAGEGVRVESGVARDGGVISVHYDPMLAKVIAWAPTRTEAASRLADVLSRARLHGVATNRDLLVRVLRHEAFLSGRTDTGFLGRHDGDGLRLPRADAFAEGLHAVAAALAGQAERRARATIGSALPSGWRNNRSQLQQASFEGASGRHDVGYCLGGDGRVELDGRTLDLTVVAARPDRVELIAEGVRRVFRVAASCDGVTVDVDSPLGHTVLRVLDRFPRPPADVPAGSLVAPMPGTVVIVAVSVGQLVSEGEVMAVIEAMKMQHEIVAPVAGRVGEVAVSVGAAVDAGAVLVVLEP
ncbi:MAG: ATP-grasp domain-containing protein [Actinobacteria bacterium]|nr:ATP-grasp domain-containing protein [Actinomycetota bacterium]